jgi:superfamily II DNA or RNA helicase
MSYAVGSLVKTRGREWVVLPESNNEWLVLRPLGGADQEIAGVYLPLEQEDVQPAAFADPDPQDVGDFRSCRMLRDAVRLGFRSSAGPFRSFARINVEPRPYQLVPLLMALKHDPVRLLIADDVGIGKTIEAGVIVRELLDRGEIRRLAVLCPPHLAEQWQSELAEKFHIRAELVLTSTVTRLERGTAVGQSLFDLHPFVIVSTEYIKSPRRREEFIRVCPELVIVDEAHTCAFSPDNRGGRHLRHQLLQQLAAKASRHLILVTATPHSGNEGAFRSLLGLLRPDFLDLPEDLSGRANEGKRREVAQHLVQRRRADIRLYLEADTTFPEREDAEATYTLTPEYKKLFNNLLEYARERVLDDSGSAQRQRVRWWSALALLRSLASSPAAAAATLRTRSGTVDTETADAADEIGERAVLDLDDADTSEFLDAVPGSQEGDEQPDSERQRLLRFARRADALFGPEQDAKLNGAITLVKRLLKDGFQPILFCRFIPTAEYLAEQLRLALPNKVEVAAVTGKLPPAERENRVELLGQFAQRVLVATDCLSEGINLQGYFNAVVHYDLSWNPTRHEQREGRVDRYGQAHPTVRALTYYGVDNQIDGIVLDVLLRKHQRIRSSLGISVPLPGNTSEVVKALMEGMMLRGGQVEARQIAFDFMQTQAQDLHTEWENVANKEKASRTMFAQHSLDVSEVAREWRAVREAIGTAVDVEQFVSDAVRAHGGHISQRGLNTEIRLPDKAALRDLVSVHTGGQEKLTVRFELPVAEQATYLSRTHPLVEGLAAYTLDVALDPLLEGVAKRAGVTRTKAVSQATTLLLLRFRYHIVTRKRDEEIPLLAEECQVVGYTGREDNPVWLSAAAVAALLQANPDANVPPPQAVQFMRRKVDSLPQLQPALTVIAEERGQLLLDAHRRVRTAARQTGARYTVQPQLPPDVLGVYVLLPIIS